MKTQLRLLLAGFTATLTLAAPLQEDDVSSSLPTPTPTSTTPGNDMGTDAEIGQFWHKFNSYIHHGHTTKQCNDFWATVKKPAYDGYQLGYVECLDSADAASSSTSTLSTPTSTSTPDICQVADLKFWKGFYAEVHDVGPTVKECKDYWKKIGEPNDDEGFRVGYEQCLDSAKFDHSSVSSDLTVATSTEAAVPSYTDSSAMVTASMDEPEPTSTGDEGLGNLGSMMN